MKKLALIMLAVVSMALVSCGGGGKDGKQIKPTSTGITYENYIAKEKNVPLLGCYELKSVGVRKVDDTHLMVSATIKALEKVSVDFLDAKLGVFDNNMVLIKQVYLDQDFPKLSAPGDVFTVSGDLETEDVQKLLNEIEYVQVQEVCGHKW